MVGASQKQSEDIQMDLDEVIYIKLISEQLEEIEKEM